MIDIEFYQLNYFQNSEPVPYQLKKGGIIYIYPVLVKNYFKYEYAKTILEYAKNETNDINIIKMSYLEFLYNIIKQNENEGIKLYTLLNICLKTDNVSFVTVDNKIQLALTDKNDNVKYLINKKEFDEIGKIILNQNDANYDNRYISPDVKRLMEVYNRATFENRHSPSLEERKAFISSKIGKSFKELGELTYREFDLIYTQALNSEMYIGDKIIQGSFKYKTDDKILHPMFREKVDPYSKLFEETSVLANKGISGAEQLNNINLE